jgi:hypothetical protein
MKHDSVGIKDAHALFQFDMENTKLDLVEVNSYITKDVLYKLYLVEPTIGTSQS